MPCFSRSCSSATSRSLGPSSSPAAGGAAAAGSPLPACTAWTKVLDHLLNCLDVGIQNAIMSDAVKGC